MEACDGLVIPGGESTTMLKLLGIENLLEPLREFGQKEADLRNLRRRDPDRPRSLAPEQTSLDLMDIGVQRNAYGRQMDSHIAKL